MMLFLDSLWQFERMLNHVHISQNLLNGVVRNTLFSTDRCVERNVLILGVSDDLACCIRNEFASRLSSLNVAATFEQAKQSIEKAALVPDVAYIFIDGLDSFERGFDIAAKLQLHFHIPDVFLVSQQQGRDDEMSAFGNDLPFIVRAPKRVTSMMIQ